MTSEAIENYILRAGQIHRKNFGQFFTPAIVSKLMCEWVLQGTIDQIIDPSFGLGSFYFEAIKVKPRVRYTGYEIDQNIIEYFNDESRELHPGLEIEICDYLMKEVKQAEGIICNPPYLRFQKFVNRHEILPTLKKKLGEDILGYSNIASLFLLKSVSELKKKMAD